MWEAML
jgi:acetoin utilization deacetylase AcuC-like enzyme